MAGDVLREGRRDERLRLIRPPDGAVEDLGTPVGPGPGAHRLAREEEIATLYPDYEVGAMPPFGAVHGHRVFVDQCLVGEPELVFNAGTHTEALCMHYGDVAELAKPIVGVFTKVPGGRKRTVESTRRHAES